MIFVDASAMVAILGDEPERDAYLEICLQNDCVTSPIALFEAALGLCRRTTCTIDESLEDLTDFLAETGIGAIAITPEDGILALSAAKRFGKGQGHPARRFAYACAVRIDAKLLYKGDDFSRTDIASAVA